MPEENSIKNKVTLSDYQYRKDIDNRLLISALSVSEIEVMREVLDGPLKYSVTQLASNLNVSKEKLSIILENLSKSRLFVLQGDFISVDKERRRYFEIQIQKFDDDFIPNMDFLQGLLNNVPIHVLPTWYDLPSSSNHIFKGIVENYLLTPKTYERYLKRLQFKESKLNQIATDVLTAPGYSIRSKELMEKYSLTLGQFEECIMLLEYSLVCSQSFRQLGNGWEGVVMPFQEWQEYASTQKKTLPKAIKDVASIKRQHSDDFAFGKDLANLLRALSQPGLNIPYETYANSIVKLLEKSSILGSVFSRDYVEKLVKILLELGLVAVEKNKLMVTQEATAWLKKPVQEHSASVYRLSVILAGSKNNPFSPYGDRDIREIERGLKRVARLGWIYLEDFIAGLTATVGNQMQVQLQARGKRWRYVLPNYSEADRTFIKRVVLEVFFEGGIIAVGTHEGRPCFCVTAFGRSFIGD
jgi:hypothetical protein